MIRLGTFRFRTVKPDDPLAAGIHQPGRFAFLRYPGSLHGSIVYISGVRPGHRDYRRERAWMVFW